MTGTCVAEPYACAESPDIVDISVVPIEPAPTVAGNVEPSAVVIVKVFPLVPEPTAKPVTPATVAVDAAVICPLLLNVITGTADAEPTLAPVTTLVSFEEAMAFVAIDA